MAFPYLFPACFFTAGIWLAPKLGLRGGPALSLAGVSLVSSWLLYFLSKKGSPYPFLLIAALFLGTAALSTWEDDYKANPVRALRVEGYADFFGRLYKSPSRGIDRDYIFLRLEKLEVGGRTRAAVGNLRVSVAHSEVFPQKIKFITGDRVRLSAKILEPAEFRNFGPSLSAGYLKSQNLHGLAFCKSPLLFERLETGQAFGAMRLASALRQSLQNRIEAHFPDAKTGGLSQPGAVLEALLLGERRRIDDEVTLDFQESGLLHLIAISGAHIGIISVLLLTLFRFAGLASRPSALALVVLLVFYSLLVEGTASVLRATIMASAYLVGRLLWREAHILNAMAFSALFLLLANPFNLFDPGFQLTYAATLAIVLYQPRLVKCLPRLPLKIGEMLALSLAAQLGVMPLVAAAFNRVAVAPLLLNLAAVPLVAVIMAAGYIFLPLALIAASLAHPLALVLKPMLSLLMALSRLSEASSVLSYRVPNPGLWVVIGYYVFLLAFLLPRRFRLQVPLAFAGWAAFTLVLVLHPFGSKSENLRLTFLDVGQGDSILIEFPGTRKMLVDGGGMPTGSFDPGERVVSPFLWRLGVKKLDTIVSSHAHPDHIKGLASIARNFNPAELWEAPGLEENLLRQRLLEALPSRAVRRNVGRGFVRTEAGVRVEVLHPGRDGPSRETEANDRSIVLRISWGRTVFLLTGDVGLDAEKEIIQAGLVLCSGVLKAGHHGSDSSSGGDFLERVRPRVAIITVGRTNSYGLPQEEVLRRLEAAGAVIYRTDKDGAVEIIADGRSYAVRTASDPERYRVFQGGPISAVFSALFPACSTGPRLGARYSRHS
jgi:competence protein ComEC